MVKAFLLDGLNESFHEGIRIGHPKCRDFYVLGSLGKLRVEQFVNFVSRPCIRNLNYNRSSLNPASASPRMNDRRRFGECRTQILGGGLKKKKFLLL